MKLNERERAMLRLIAASPRTSHSFTHGDSPCSPHVIQCYLNHMASTGLIAPPLRHNGNFEITEEGREYLAQEREAVPSRIWGNASTTTAYVPPRMESPRAGADQHRQYASRGIGA
jgi:hypothetical protein